MSDWKQHIHERTLADLQLRCKLLGAIHSEDGRYALFAFCLNDTDKVSVRAVKNAKDPSEWQLAANEALVLICNDHVVAGTEVILYEPVDPPETGEFWCGRCGVVKVTEHGVQCSKCLGTQKVYAYVVPAENFMPIEESDHAEQN